MATLQGGYKYWQLVIGWEATGLWEAAGLLEAIGLFEAAGLCEGRNKPLQPQMPPYGTPPFFNIVFRVHLPGRKNSVREN